MEKTKRKVTVATPTGMTTGKYTLNCNLDGLPNKIGFKEKILVYNKPRIDDVSQNETMVDTATNVTVTGTGFIQTPTLRCVLFVNHRPPVFIKATFVSQTTIICSLERIAQSQHGFISVLFNAKAVKQAKDMAKRFSIYHLLPELRKCMFNKKRNYLNCYFNRPIECGDNDKWQTCSSFLDPATLSKLPAASRCGCKGFQLRVQIPRDSDLRPGQAVRILLRSINRQGSGYTKHSLSERQVNVEDYPNPEEFTVSLAAEKEVGK